MKSAQDLIEGKTLKIWEWVEVAVASTLVVEGSNSLFILKEASLVMAFLVVLDLIFNCSEGWFFLPLTTWAGNTNMTNADWYTVVYNSGHQKRLVKWKMYPSKSFAQWISSFLNL